MTLINFRHNLFFFKKKKLKLKLIIFFKKKKGKGLIGELIVTFRSMVKTLKTTSGSVKREKSYSRQEEMEKFSVAYKKPDLKEIRESIEGIQDKKKLNV